MNSAAIIFSNLNNHTLSRLTADRTVAAIPFACRYRLIDFALSNMINANISRINVVANYNYRSLLDHIGSGKDWDLARRDGGISFISPYQTARSANVKMYSTHMEALRSIAPYIDDMKENYVVLADCDGVANIDIAAAIASHEESGAEITFVSKACDLSYTSKTPRLMFRTDEDGWVQDALLSASYSDACPELFLNVFIMSCERLRRIIAEANAHDYQSLTRDFIMRFAHEGRFRVFRHEGYYAGISSFTDYFRHSINLTHDEEAYASLLGRNDRRIFTKVHNSAPVVYAGEAKVKSSLIADDCVIEGTVENCILFRGVRVGRGSVVRNSILFGNTHVGSRCSLNCVVADKSVVISDDRTLSGHESLPFYIAKGRRI